MKQINLHNKVLSADLSILLEVSEDTIRRDLKELDEEGKVVKVHGGAISKSFHYPFNKEHEVYAQEAKQQIAAKALRLLKDDMVVLTGGGTTMIELARKIPESLRATFFTVSPLVALELVEHPNITVISLGGQLSKNTHINVGASVINELSGLRIDLLLMGANGISAEEGMTDSDWDAVQVKKAMIRASKKVAVLSLAEKLNSIQYIKVCEIDRINYLITDLSPDNDLLSSYKGLNLNLL